MARGITITPSGGSAVPLVPRPGSIALAYEPMDVGGDGIPNCRNATPMKCDFEVVVDETSPTYVNLLALRTQTTAEANSSVEVEFHAAKNDNTYTISQASVRVSLEGEGVMTASISVKGNGVLNE